MKILVTGSTGLLGRHLVKRLLDENHQVVALGRSQNIGKILNTQGAKFIACELNDFCTMHDAAAGADAIVHCGALSKPWGRYSAFYQANVLGTKHVLECAQAHHVKRLVHISSPSVYFNFCDQLNITESIPLPKHSANHYIRTKKQAEALVDQYTCRGLDTITLRPRAIFGPFDTTIFPRILNTVRNNKFPLINQGRAIIDITYVDNVVEAICLALAAPRQASGKKYNITNGEPMPVKEILDKLFRALDMDIQYKPVHAKLAFGIAKLLELKAKLSFRKDYEPRLTQYGVGVLCFDQTLNLQQAKDLLGYHPVVSVDQGLNYFAQWWRAYDK